MTNQVHTDKPVFLQSEDRFQRYEFSKRIASIIATSKIDKFLIVELYGQAVLKDKSEKTEAFLENAINLHNNDDATIIRTVLDSEPTIGFENYKDDNIQKKFETEKLKKKIEELEKF